MGQWMIYVGFDAHKDPIAVALTIAGLRGAVRDRIHLVVLKVLTVQVVAAEWSCGFATRPYRTERQWNHDNGAHSGRAVVAPSLTLASQAGGSKWFVEMRSTLGR
jgi:hypothetical protein